MRGSRDRCDGAESELMMMVVVVVGGEAAVGFHIKVSPL